LATAIEHRIEVVHRHRHVMDAGAALVDVLRDRRVGAGGLEQFHERGARRQSGDPCPVAVGQWNDRQAEDVAKEGEGIVQCADRESEVRDGRAAGMRSRLRIHEGSSEQVGDLET
jgi:hypothetical protein